MQQSRLLLVKEETGSTSHENVQSPWFLLSCIFSKKNA